MTASFVCKNPLINDFSVGFSHFAKDNKESKKLFPLAQLKVC